MSGPKDCQQKASNQNQSGWELHPDKQGHVTVAPNIEISPTGPRPVWPSLGAEFKGAGAANESYIEMPYTGLLVGVLHEVILYSNYTCIQACYI